MYLNVDKGQVALDSVLLAMHPNIALAFLAAKKQILNLLPSTSPTFCSDDSPKSTTGKEESS